MIFKREDTTRRVFERIREARPPRLYIAADGPRVDRPDEVEKCNSTRKVVENVDWPCEVHHLYREENLGCGKGVSSAITWFFEHEEQGIIIEDDILAHIDFFTYCDELLERYKDDERTQLISGWNWIYNGYKANNSSYYLSPYMSIWGWATWKRVWDTYSFDLKGLDDQVVIKALNEMLPHKSVAYLCDFFTRMKSFQIDTWDYQLWYNQFLYGRYSIIPYTNMITNIGFDEDASHTKKGSSKTENRTASSPYPLIHPSYLDLDPIAIKMTMINAKVYKKTILFRLWIKVKQYVKMFINIVIS